MTDWHVDIARYYFGQCNEALTQEEILQLVRLECSLTYSAYELEEEEADRLYVEFGGEAQHIDLETEK